jgi:hypothetical protein
MAATKTMTHRAVSSEVNGIQPLLDSCKAILENSLGVRQKLRVIEVGNHGPHRIGTGFKLSREGSVVRVRLEFNVLGRFSFVHVHAYDTGNRFLKFNFIFHIFISARFIINLMNEYSFRDKNLNWDNF